MLKIVSAKPGPDLDKLVLNHYHQVNGKVKSRKNRGKYKKNSVNFRLTAAVAGSAGDEKLFFEYLRGSSDVMVETLLMGKPPQLKSIIDEVEQKFPGLHFFKKTAKGGVKPTALGTKVAKIFDYKAYRKSKGCIALLKELGYADARPCPYCNVDDISIVRLNAQSKKEDLGKALLDMDHFFAKYKYPFLSVSFYNLIPSCHNCNARYKGFKDFKLDSHIHPYVHDFDDTFVFRLEKAFDPGQTVADISFDVANKIPFSKQSITDFDLTGRYHAYRTDLLRMLKYVHKEYKRVKDVNLLFGGATVAKELFEVIHVPVEKKDIVFYKKGKLKRDLLLDIGLFKAVSPGP